MTSLDFLPTEATFQSLLDDADHLPGQFEALSAEGLPPMMAGDNLPEATLRRLGAWAEMEYHGAIVLLRNADVAHTTEVMLRGLLEFYAHVSWIHQGPAGDLRDQAGRALCLELGIANEALTSLSKIEKWTGDGQDVASADDQINVAAKRRVADVTPMHAATGCDCKGRSYRGVGSWLQELYADGQGLTWPYGLWVISSAAAHQLLPDRIMVDLGNGVSDFIAHAPYVWRGNLLGYSIRAYGMACIRVLDMVNAKNAERLNAIVVALLSDQRMQAAESEQLDREAIAFMDAQ